MGFSMAPSSKTSKPSFPVSRKNIVVKPCSALFGCCSNRCDNDFPLRTIANRENADEGKELVRQIIDDEMEIKDKEEED